MLSEITLRGSCCLGPPSPCVGLLLCRQRVSRLNNLPQGFPKSKIHKTLSCRRCVRRLTTKADPGRISTTRDDKMTLSTALVETPLSALIVTNPSRVLSYTLLETPKLRRGAMVGETFRLPSSSVFETSVLKPFHRSQTRYANSTLEE